MFLKGLFVLSVIIVETYGLSCWTCDNSRGTGECLRKGKLMRCQPNEHVCFTGIRNNNGFFEVEKRCKQANACQNNHIQNPREASIQAQCNGLHQSSVCRCCCDTYACNKRGLFCNQETPACPFVPKPLNGFSKCEFNTSATEVGSVCAFSCKSGYNLVGAPDAECVKDPKGGKPKFEPATPVCQPGKCSPEMADIANGAVVCTNGAEIGSNCQYTCDAGYGLHGASAVVCGKNGKWSDHPPVCNPLQCKSQNAPLNGAVACEHPGLIVGSGCDFTCNEGYALVGTTDNLCIESAPGFAEWSESPPVCDPIICLPPHEAPEGGSVSCTNDEFLGSVCSFACDDGFEMLGQPQSECMQDFGVFGIWTTEAPECVPVLADPCPAMPDTLRHGDILCSDGHAPGSECLFFCDAGFAHNGNPTSVCQNDGSWSHKVPKCVATSCGPIEPIANGTVTCTDGSDIASTCTFECDKSQGLQLYPATIEQNQCLIQADGTAKWFPPTPCCSLPCPPFIMMDFVVVMDSSSSVQLPNWEIQVKFTRILIERFNLGPNSARMSIFRYNSHVDEDSEIRLNTVLDGDMDRFVSLFEKIPYNGRGTKTGEALVHAQTKSLSAEYGNRPDVKDVVLVITDGKAEDPKLVKDVSKQMRDSGIMIFAVGIGVNDFTFQRLTKMTGSIERTVRADDFEQLISGGLPEKLGATLCRDPCFKS